MESAYHWISTNQASHSSSRALKPCAQAGDVNARCGAGCFGHGAAVMETGDHNLDVKTKRRRNRETVGKTDGRTNGQTGERTDRRINISSRATDATGVHEGRRVKTL